jgi:endoglucanase
VVCDEPPKPFHWEDFAKCSCDDRWAFTTRCTALDYGSAAALAGAGRVLKGYNDSLSSECIMIAKSTWDREQREPAHTFHFGNTTGGPIEVEELNAAVELLILTRENKYAEKISELLPYIEKNFGRVASSGILAIPYMNNAYKQTLKDYTSKYKIMLDNYSAKNPYGVIISGGGWAGSGQAINSAITNFFLNKAFPEIIGPEYVYRGLNYIFGCHPGSDISFVSGAGTHSKRVAYGNNRADFTYIAGGIVPGVLLLKPDFPENKEDWPFLWGENEYVINLAGSYIFLVNAVNELLEKEIP